MRIGIIGAGRIGSNLAAHFARAGHEVSISNSRGPESLAEKLAEIGPGATATTSEEAASSSEVVVIAVRWTQRNALPDADFFADKIVIDAMNPYSASWEVLDLEEDTSSELVARQLPAARVVKAFNTIYFEHLRDRAGEDPPLAVFVASDDEDAKEKVSGLIREIGFDPVDSGSLRDGGRRQQPNSPIYNHPMSADQARRMLESLD